MGILDHDNGGIHHGADGDGDPAQGHDIGVDAFCVHHHESNQYPHRQAEDNHQGGTQVKQEHDAHQRHHQEFLQQFFVEGIHRPAD